MKRSFMTVVAAVALSVSALAHAERPDHYSGLPSETLEQAVANFSEYNSKLESVLAGELNPAAMNEVHQLTYTLENALEKISDELDRLADTLEEVHLGSESNNADAVRNQGKEYLETSRKLVP